MKEPRVLPPELEERLARYRARRMATEERAAFEREVLGDEALAEALYSELSLDAVRGEVGTAAGPRAPHVRPLHAAPRRHMGGARILALAAVVLVVSALVVWKAQQPRAPQPGGDSMRGEASLTALEPSGTLEAAPVRFRWSRDPGAASYRVELFDLGGNNRGAGVSTDTVLAFGAVARDTISAGEWRVVAIGPDGLDRPARARAAFRIVPR